MTWMTKSLNTLSHIWLFGALFRTGRKTYAQALYEFAYLVIWSILPFLLGALTLYVTSDAADKTFYILALSTFRNGELLVFTISMLAPILYIVLHDPEQAESFPHKLPISTMVTLTAVTCAALFALMKASAIKDGNFVFQFSVVLTVLALFFRYLAIVYHRIRMPSVSEDDLRADQNGFVQQYRKHIGEPSVQPQQQAADFAKAFEKHMEDKK